MKLPVLLCDLDDTLADARRRMPLWGNWDAFYEDAINDPVIYPMVNVVHLLSRNFNLIIVTAREEKYRDTTTKWLLRNGVYATQVLMRPNGNFMTSPVLKLSLVEEFFGPMWRNRVALVIDDRDDVLRAFREHGIMTLQAFYPNGLNHA